MLFLIALRFSLIYTEIDICWRIYLTIKVGSDIILEKQAESSAPSREN